MSLLMGSSILRPVPDLPFLYHLSSSYSSFFIIWFVGPPRSRYPEGCESSVPSLLTSSALESLWWLESARITRYLALVCLVCVQTSMGKQKSWERLYQELPKHAERWFPRQLPNLFSPVEVIQESQ